MSQGMSNREECSSVLHTQRHFSACSAVKNFIAEFAERYYRHSCEKLQYFALALPAGCG